MENTSEFIGGQGGIAPFSRSDLDLARLAIRRRWGVPSAFQTEALFQVGQILATTTDERHRLSAIKLLVEMTKVDQRDDMEAEDEADTYDDIPENEPDVEPRHDSAQEGMQG